MNDITSNALHPPTDYDWINYLPKDALISFKEYKSIFNLCDSALHERIRLGRASLPDVVKLTKQTPFNHSLTNTNIKRNYWKVSTVKKDVINILKLIGENTNGN